MDTEAPEFWNITRDTFQNFFFSSYVCFVTTIKARRMRWAGAICTNGVVGGKARGKEPLGRPRCRWLDNIRMDLVEVGWSDVDWIGLAQDRDRWRALVNAVLNLQVPKMLGNYRVSKQLGISRVVLSSMELVLFLGEQFSTCNTHLSALSNSVAVRVHLRWGEFSNSRYGNVRSSCIKISGADKIACSHTEELRVLRPLA
jgi:hypothetical protein